MVEEEKDGEIRPQVGMLAGRERNNVLGSRRASSWLSSGSGEASGSLEPECWEEVVVLVAGELEAWSAGIGS